MAWVCFTNSKIRFSSTKFDSQKQISISCKYPSRIFMWKRRGCSSKNQNYTPPIWAWIRIYGSFSKDDDGKKDKKAIGLDKPAKQQLCTCITLFCTFLAVIAWLRRETSQFTWRRGQKTYKTKILFCFIWAKMETLRIQLQKISTPWLNEIEWEEVCQCANSFLVLR